MTPEQRKYLNALRNFENAAFELLEQWTAVAAAATKYPFKHSFEQVCHEILAFREAVEAELQTIGGKCDCESTRCEKVNEHRAGNCKQPATRRVQSYGHWQNLCQRCDVEGGPVSP